MEIWKQVPGTEYIASSTGRVARFRLLKPSKNKFGYYKAAYRKGTKFKHSTAHILVAEAFLGPRPKGKFVNHKNGVKTDNRPENLEWVTPKENGTHASKMGLYRKGDKHPRAVSSKIRGSVVELYRSGEFTMLELAERFKVSKASVQRWVRGSHA